MVQQQDHIQNKNLGRVQEWKQKMTIVVCDIL